MIYGDGMLNTKWSEKMELRTTRMEDGIIGGSEWIPDIGFCSCVEGERGENWISSSRNRLEEKVAIRSGRNFSLSVIFITGCVCLRLPPDE